MLGTPLVLAALSHLLTSSVQAFPDFAGSCDAGVAVGPQHFDATEVVNGTLEDKGVGLAVNGVDLLQNPNTTLPVGQDLNWTVTANAMPMRGILFRVEALDGSDATSSLSTDSDLLQPSNLCDAPVAGITHNSVDDKTVAEGTIRFDEPKVVQLDVTVVFANNDALSDYAYAGVEVNFEVAEPCFICGDPDLVVDPTLELDFEGSIFPCSEIEAFALIPGNVSPELCGPSQVAVIESCNCQPRGSFVTTMAPSYSLAPSVSAAPSYSLAPNSAERAPPSEPPMMMPMSSPIDAPVQPPVSSASAAATAILALPLMLVLVLAL